jgi:hypothetical protein
MLSSDHFFTSAVSFGVGGTSPSLKGPMESSRLALPLFWSKACERRVEEFESGSRCVAYVLYTRIAPLLLFANNLGNDLEHEAAVERTVALCIPKDSMLDVGTVFRAG